MRDKAPQDCEVTLKSSGYEVSLTHVPTGKTVTITLTPNPANGHRHKRLEWRVDAKGFMGKYASLETAFEEATAQLKKNLKGGGALG